MGETPPNPSRLANGQGFRPPPPQPFTTCKWTRVGGPPKPSPLANGQGLPPLPPTLHDLQMDKGFPPPPPCPHQQTPTQRPNPLRLADGQGLPSPPQPITTCKWTRVAGPPTFMTWGRPAAPQPFTTCKWTRLLHDLQMDKGWGPRNPSRLGGGLQMDKGWGRLPNGQGLGAPKPPICKWTRVGAQPFNPARLANGQGLGAPTLHVDKGWGPPNPSQLANGQRLDKGWGLPALPVD